LLRWDPRFLLHTVLLVGWGVAGNDGRPAGGSGYGGHLGDFSGKPLQETWVVKSFLKRRILI
jgi:hypothetical protein